MRLNPANAVLMVCLGFSLHTSARADLGDRTSEDQCHSTDPILERICKIAGSRFEAPPSSYIHLGGDYYLMPVGATGRIAQGLYVANLKTGKISMFGGYGYPHSLSANHEGEDNLWINITQGSMSRGIGWEVESVLERRINPLTKTPYLITHSVQDTRYLSEEMEAFCDHPGSSQNSECVETRRTTYPNEDLQQIRSMSWPGDRTQVKRILAAHQKALLAYKRNKFEDKRPYQILEEAGVWGLLQKEPKTMTRSQYVQVLNDYAFLVYQSR